MLCCANYVVGLREKLQPVREEFMKQCFQRLEAQSSNTVYSIVEIWGIDHTQARLTHLSMLLEQGQDDVIGELLNHVSSSLSFVRVQTIQTCYGCCVSYFVNLVISLYLDWMMLC